MKPFKALFLAIIPFLLGGCFDKTQKFNIYSKNLINTDFADVDNDQTAYTTLDIQSHKLSTEYTFRLHGLEIVQTQKFVPFMYGTWTVESDVEMPGLKVMIGTGNIITDSFEELPVSRTLSANHEYTISVLSIKQEHLDKDIKLKVSVQYANRNLSYCSYFKESGVAGQSVEYDFIPNATGKHVFFMSREYMSTMRLKRGSTTLDYGAWGNVSAVLNKGELYTLRIEYLSKATKPIGKIERPVADTVDITNALNTNGYVTYRYKIVKNSHQENYFKYHVASETGVYVSSGLNYIKVREQGKGSGWEYYYGPKGGYYSEPEVDANITYADEGIVGLYGRSKVDFDPDEARIIQGIHYKVSKNEAKNDRIITIRNTVPKDWLENGPLYAYITFFKKGFEFQYKELSQEEFAEYCGYSFEERTKLYK